MVDLTLMGRTWSSHSNFEYRGGDVLGTDDNIRFQRFLHGRESIRGATAASIDRLRELVCSTTDDIAVLNSDKPDDYDKSAVYDKSEGHDKSEAPAAEQSSYVDAEISEILGDVVLCWVKVAEQFRVKASIPRNLFGDDVRLIPGVCFEWSPEKSVIQPVKRDPALEAEIETLEDQLKS